MENGSTYTVVEEGRVRVRRLSIDNNQYIPVPVVRSYRYILQRSSTAGLVIQETALEDLTPRHRIRKTWSWQIFKFRTDSVVQRNLGVVISYSQLYTKQL